MDCILVSAELPLSSADMEVLLQNIQHKGRSHKPPKGAVQGPKDLEDENFQRVFVCTHTCAHATHIALVCLLKSVRTKGKLRM